VVVDNPFAEGMDTLPPGSDPLTIDDYLARRRNTVATDPQAVRYLGGAALVSHEVLTSTRALREDHKQVFQAHRAASLEQARAHLRTLADGPNTEVFLGVGGLSASDKDYLTEGGQRTLLDSVLGLDDSELLGLLQMRKRTFAPHVDEQEFRIERRMFQFKENVARAVARQHLPIDGRHAQRKIDTTMLVAVDPLTLHKHHDASFSPYDRLARIGLHLGRNTQSFGTAVDHELTHALGGIASAVNPDVAGSIYIRRSGLSLVSQTQHRLKWLNEAVTERLSLMLSLPDINYRLLDRERMLRSARVTRYIFQDLIMREVLHGVDQDVSFYTVLEPYFEDDAPTQPIGSRSPYQIKLHDAFAAIWKGIGNIEDILYEPHDQPVQDADVHSSETNPYLKTIDTLRQRRLALSV
jgi:hypothetical protein